MCSSFVSEGYAAMITNPKKSQRKPLIITRRDEQILREIYQYRYMTALDVAWLFFKPSSHTHVREILSMLSGGQDLATQTYLCRFGLPSVGNAERVFTLGAKGRNFLAEHGLPMTWYFRPYKLKHFSASHVQHQLLVTRCVVAAHVWSRKQSEFNLLNVRFGHEFRRTPGKVTREIKGDITRVPVIPDAWLLFERVSNGNELPIFLEIDRGMEYQQRFKQHIRSRIQFIEDGGYTRTFGSRSVTVAYATTGQTPAYRDTRRKAMALWTNEVLEELGKNKWAGVFRFASVDVKGLFDLALFNKPVWYRPDSPTPRTLLSP
jgi:hypothetical protein